VRDRERERGEHIKRERNKEREIEELLKRERRE
jgi:hypothetical protein